MGCLVCNSPSLRLADLVRFRKPTRQLWCCALREILKFKPSRSAGGGNQPAAEQRQQIARGQIGELQRADRSPGFPSHRKQPPGLIPRLCRGIRPAGTALRRKRHPGLHQDSPRLVWFTPGYLLPLLRSSRLWQGLRLASDGKPSDEVGCGTTGASLVTCSSSQSTHDAAASILRRLVTAW